MGAEQRPVGVAANCSRCRGPFNSGRISFRREVICNVICSDCIDLEREGLTDRGLMLCRGRRAILRLKSHAEYAT